MAERLSLFRHGAVDAPPGLYGRSDPPPEAASMARLVAAICRLRPDAIASSPLQRAALPARAAAGRLGLTAAIDPDLAEFDFGDWDGGDWASWTDWPALQRFYEDPIAHPPPGAESMAAFEHRVAAAFARWRSAPAEHPAAVAHGGVLRACLALSLGVPVAHPGLQTGLALPTGSRIEWRRSGEHWQLSAIEPGDA